jgi:hypothetical protein
MFLRAVTAFYTPCSKYSGPKLGPLKSFGIEPRRTMADWLAAFMCQPTTPIEGDTENYLSALKVIGCYILHEHEIQRHVYCVLESYNNE